MIARVYLNYNTTLLSKEYFKNFLVIFVFLVVFFKPAKPTMRCSFVGFSILLFSSSEFDVKSCYLSLNDFLRFSFTGSDS